MKTFVGGLMVGGAVTAATLIGYAYGQAARNVQDLAALTAGSCRVTVGYGQMTPGTQCSFNKVQVGSQSGYLLCADISVDCGG